MADRTLILEIISNIRTMLEINDQMQLTVQRMAATLDKQPLVISQLKEWSDDDTCFTEDDNDLGFETIFPQNSGFIEHGNHVAIPQSTIFVSSLTTSALKHHIDASDAANSNLLNEKNSLFLQSFNPSSTHTQAEYTTFDCGDFPKFSSTLAKVGLCDGNTAAPMPLICSIGANHDLWVAHVNSEVTSALGTNPLTLIHDTPDQNDSDVAYLVDSTKLQNLLQVYPQPANIPTVSPNQCTFGSSANVIVSICVGIENYMINLGIITSPVLVVLLDHRKWPPIVMCWADKNHISVVVLLKFPIQNTRLTWKGGTTTLIHRVHVSPRKSIIPTISTNKLNIGSSAMVLEFPTVILDLPFDVMAQIVQNSESPIWVSWPIILETVTQSWKNNYVQVVKEVVLKNHQLCTSKVVRHFQVSDQRLSWKGGKANRMKLHAKCLGLGHFVLKGHAPLLFKDYEKRNHFRLTLLDTSHARETIQSQNWGPLGFTHVSSQPAQPFGVVCGTLLTTSCSHFTYFLCHIMNPPILRVPAFVQHQLLVLEIVRAAIVHASRETQADSGSQIAINNCDDHGLLDRVLVYWAFQYICAAWSTTMIHWQNYLTSVTFIPIPLVRSSVLDKTSQKVLMGIKVRIGNTYWSRGGTRSLLDNGLLNTYPKVMVQCNWSDCHEGLLIIYVPLLAMKWIIVRKKYNLKGQRHRGSWGLLTTSIMEIHFYSAHEMVLDFLFTSDSEVGVEYNILHSSNVISFCFNDEAMKESLFDYSSVQKTDFKHRCRMKQNQHGIGIYKEVNMDCTFGIKTAMWVFAGSTLHQSIIIPSQTHKSQGRIKCSDAIQPNLKAKILKRVQCFIVNLENLDQAFTNQSPLRQSQNCHSQLMNGYAMSRSQSQHYYWVPPNPYLTQKIMFEYFTMYVQLRLGLFWSWACVVLHNIWARYYICKIIRLAQLLLVIIHVEDAIQILWNEHLNQQDYKCDFNTFGLLTFSPKLSVGPSLEFILQLPTKCAVIVLKQKTTWEDISNLRQRIHAFHLEDKVNLKGGGNVMNHVFYWELAQLLTTTSQWANFQPNE